MESLPLSLTVTAALDAFKSVTSHRHRKNPVVEALTLSWVSNGQLGNQTSLSATLLFTAFSHSKQTLKDARLDVKKKRKRKNPEPILYFKLCDLEAKPWRNFPLFPGQEVAWNCQSWQLVAKTPRQRGKE